MSCPPGARAGLLTPECAAQRAGPRDRCIELVRETDGDVVLDWAGVDSFVGRMIALQRDAAAQHHAGAAV